MTLTHLVLAAVVLTWLMIMAASGLRSGFDLKLGLGNRDNLPEASPLAGRADRAAKNMLENLILFVALALAAGPSPRATLGAEIFVLARLAYWPIYLAGIHGVRTAVWAVSVVGLGLLASAAW
jgi:uncharacterized MAPEG superfamily protein